MQTIIGFTKEVHTLDVSQAQIARLVNFPPLVGATLRNQTHS